MYVCTCGSQYKRKRYKEMIGESINHESITCYTISNDKMYVILVFLALDN